MKDEHGSIVASIGKVMLVLSVYYLLPFLQICNFSTKFGKIYFFLALLFPFFLLPPVENIKKI